MITFRAITEDNFDAIIAMKRPEGERFVAPNSVSLAQAWLYRDNGDVFPCAIYEEEAPVGFLLLEEDAEERKLMLWRIMFPPEHTNKGYGTDAVRLLIRLAKESGRYDGLYLDCAPANTAARHVYEKLGFRPTGDINHGDVEMCLKL
ncbi:MAG: GNAT family N-acetyltransferase [Candidatus Onthomonas sp.]